MGFCGLPGADRQLYIDEFKLLGIENCPYEIPRTEWTLSYVQLPYKDDVDNMALDITFVSKYRQCHPLSLRTTSAIIQMCICVSCCVGE